MPVLPIGRDTQSGLTLIEMLIVMVIIGISSTAAVLGVSMVGRDRRVEDEAGRLATHLQMAVDEGLVSRQRLALFWTEHGYSIKRWTVDGWQAAQTHRLVSGHDLPSILSLRRADGSIDPVQIGEDGLGPAVALEISGSGLPWVVAFNGYSAAAKPRSAP